MFATSFAELLLHSILTTRLSVQWHDAARSAISDCLIHMARVHSHLACDAAKQDCNLVDAMMSVQAVWCNWLLLAWSVGVRVELLCPECALYLSMRDVVITISMQLLDAMDMDMDMDMDMAMDMRERR